MTLKTKDELEAATVGDFHSRDELYEAAVDIVIRERRGSCSLLQRALGIGYGRAARLIDFMAEDGIVGQYNGSQARDVLISLEEWEARHRGDLEETDSSARRTTAPGRPVDRSSASNPDSSTRRSAVCSETAASVQQRRRNKIVPATEEPRVLEDDRFDDEEVEEESMDAEGYDSVDEEADDEVDYEETDVEEDEEESIDESCDEDDEDIDEEDEEWEEDQEEEWEENELSEQQPAR